MDVTKEVMFIVQVIVMLLLPFLILPFLMRDLVSFCLKFAIKNKRVLRVIRYVVLTSIFTGEVLLVAYFFVKTILPSRGLYDDYYPYSVHFMQRMHIGNISYLVSEGSERMV